MTLYECVKLLFTVVALLQLFGEEGCVKGRSICFPGPHGGPQGHVALSSPRKMSRRKSTCHVLRHLEFPLLLASFFFAVVLLITE